MLLCAANHPLYFAAAGKLRAAQCTIRACVCVCVFEHVVCVYMFDASRQTISLECCSNETMLDDALDGRCRGTDLLVATDEELFSMVELLP